MHVYFLGIGGTAIGPLALIAHQAGYQVSGSDKRDSQYIQYLKKHGIDAIEISSNDAIIKKVHEDSPIDWVVYTSAVSFEQPNHPQLIWAKQNGIKTSKRDEFLSSIITTNNLKLIAIAGTHGKTTTTAMMVWLMQQHGIKISYSVGAKISFGDMGHFDPEAEYFIYECDEFDRNFLSFYPHLSLITGVDYDHHEIYATRQDYVDAFQQFIDQSKNSILWQSDIEHSSLSTKNSDVIIDDDDGILNTLSILGNVNRRNALQVMTAAGILTNTPSSEFKSTVESFPGLSRRFEKITTNLYSDYAHTIPKIAGCLQLAKEVSDNVVVVYEPLTDRRQHYIKEQYKDLFKGIRKIYWVPSYLAREDPELAVLTPAELISELSNQEIAEAAELNSNLKQAIDTHLSDGDLVVCISGGGGASLDEWLRQNYS